jgi:hypothetical protein
MKINGSLAFDASSASEITNLRLQKYANFAAVPTYTSADAGRLIYTTDSAVIYYGSSVLSGWLALATGGSAFAQAEGDAIEASLGAGVNTSGVFVPSAFPTQPGLTSPTSFTDAINQVAAYATANNTLFELDDVALSAADPTGAKFLWTGSGDATWSDHTLVLADNSDVTTDATELNQLHTSGAVLADFVKLHAVTSSAAELNILTGATLSTTELNYVTGVTSAIQTQLNGKQPLDAGLTSLAALAGTGIIVQTADNVFAARTLVAPAAGITITDPAGIAGNPTFALADDLAALEGLTTSGYIVRTGTGTATTRSIAGVSGNTVVTNGSGVASDTSVDLATVTQASSGNFVKVTLDGFGRVTGNTAVVTADITALVDATYVNVTGDTMTGSLIMGSGTVITLPDAPVAGTDAANKAYVDALQNGLSWKTAVVVATVTAGTMATSFANGQVVDGITLVTGNRILIKDQATASQNGIYVVQASGAPVRATDMDSALEFDGSATFVQQGTINEGTGWTETLTVATVDTDPVAFSQFSGGVAYIWGTGLSNSGNTINVNLGAGVAQLPSDEVGIDLYDEPNGSLILTTDGTTHSTVTGAKLYMRLTSGVLGGLDQDATGLFIKAAGVTNAMLVNPKFSVNTDAGSDDIFLGETLQIIGTSAQGVSTAVGTNSVTITVADASTASKGVASFSSADFATAAGVVTIKAAGVDNAQLVNSVITIAGTTGSDAVALGETLTFSSTVSGLVLSSVAANNVALDVRLADNSLTGVASFNATMFSVSAGAVSIASTLGTVGLTNVAPAVDTAAANDVLSYVGSTWTNVTRTAIGGSIKLGDLQDVGTAPATTAGQVLVADGAAWQAKAIYFLYTSGAAASSHTVNHNLGQMYCNVTIVDSTDNVVIPQSIVFNSANQLTVTFNTGIDCKVVVMGVA